MILRADSCRRKIVLPHMHAIESSRQAEVGAVIHDQLEQTVRALVSVHLPVRECAAGSPAYRGIASASHRPRLALLRPPASRHSLELRGIQDGVQAGELDHGFQIPLLPAAPVRLAISTARAPMHCRLILKSPSLLSFPETAR